MRRMGFKNCPYCGSSQIYISAPKTLGERFPALFLVRLVRCHTCMRRHFRPLLLPAPKHPEEYTVPVKRVETASIKETEKRSA